MPPAHCSCSTKALDIFIRSFCGLSISPKSAQPCNPYRHALASQTPPTFVQAQRRSYSLSDSGARRDDTRGRYHNPRPARGRNADNSSDDLSRDPGQSRQIDRNENGLRIRGRGFPLARHRYASAGSQKIERQTKRNVQVDAPTTISGVSVVAGVPIAAISQASSATDMRALARKAKKLRRLKEGTWKATAQAASAQQSTAMKAVKGERKASFDQETGVGQSTVGEAADRRTSEQSSDEKGFFGREVLDDDDRFVKDLVEGDPLEEMERKATAAKEAAAKEAAAKKKEEEEEPQKKKYEKPQWQLAKEALKAKQAGKAWNPTKRISPDSLNGIRMLHESDPDTYNPQVLADHFGITYLAVRKILKSKWKPNETEIEDRRKRWEKRGVMKRIEIDEHKQRRKDSKRLLRQYDVVPFGRGSSASFGERYG